VQPVATHPESDGFAHAPVRRRRVPAIVVVPDDGDVRKRITPRPHVAQERVAQGLNAKITDRAVLSHIAGYVRDQHIRRRTS
jgi:hypothetical protein